MKKLLLFLSLFATVFFIYACSKTEPTTIDVVIDVQSITSPIDANINGESLVFDKAVSYEMSCQLEDTFYMTINAKSKEGLIVKITVLTDDKEVYSYFYDGYGEFLCNFNLSK